MTNVQFPPYENIPTTRQTSVFAVVSLVAGLTWWFWIGSIVAVVCGHIGRQEARDKGYGGDAMAVIGLVFGYMGLATFGLFVAFSVAA